MRDRYVEHPHRFRVVPVPGEENVVDLIPEPGEVYDEGTLWLKGTFLSDATAQLLGFALSDDPAVNDALAMLGRRLKVAEASIESLFRRQPTTFQQLITGRFI